MVFSNPNRRASIQRVPCSHKSEYRRLYKSSVMNAGSAVATVSVVGASFPTLTRTWSRSMWENSPPRSEEHTSELQSRVDLVCRLLLEKKNKQNTSRSHWSD